jgi:malonyl-CoA/methylmalonyl-CoA synthetase
VIEREIASSPLVSDVAVLGVPDDIYGERVAAMVALNDDGWKDYVRDGGSSQKIWEGRMRAFLKDRLAPYEIPSLYMFVKDIPRNAMGKVNKKELKLIFTSPA